MKHKPEIITVAQLIQFTPPHTDGWPALDALGLDYETTLNDEKTLARRVEVTWPEHVLSPRFNGDATYAFVD